MRTIRQGAFETNSSSAHTIVIPKQTQSIEDLIKNIDPEIKAYIEECGLVIGSGKRYDDPSFKKSKKLYNFQWRLDFLLDNLVDRCNIPMFVRGWQFLDNALKKQPFPYKINLDPDFLEHGCGCHDSRETIEDSNVLENESQFFNFIFSPLGQLIYGENEVEDELIADINTVNIYKEAPYDGGNWE